MSFLYILTVQITVGVALFYCKDGDCSLYLLLTGICFLLYIRVVDFFVCYSLLFY